MGREGEGEGEREMQFRGKMRCYVSEIRTSLGDPGSIVLGLVILAFDPS